MRLVRFLLAMGWLSLSLGCSAGTPVEEISLETSGVTVTEPSQADLSSLWPGWRGPDHNGIAPEQDLPREWSDQQNIQWRAAIPGRGHSSPVVLEDMVVLATALDDVEEQRVLAYRREDGGLQWNALVHSGNFPDRSVIHTKGTNANGTVASDGKQIYAVFFNQDRIVATALDLDGKIVWQQEVGPFSSKFGYAPSPVVYKSLVLIAADNWGGGYLAALDGTSGQIAWRVQRPAVSSYSSPTVAKVGGRDQLLISGCDMLASYDPTTGESLWQTECIAEGTCGTVVTDGNRIYASGGYPQRETVCLAANGKRLWSNRTKIYEPSMLALDGYLYAVTDDGKAYCWNGATGEECWYERLSGSFSASPILCDGMIYVPNLSGNTFVFQTRPDGYYEVAVNHLGDDCYASPAVATGKLYLRIGVGSGEERREQLVCLAQRQGQ